MALGEYWLTEWLDCLSCGHRYAYNLDYTWVKNQSREICRCCVAEMSRAEALAQVQRFPHYKFCEDPAFYGYEPHPEGLYKQWVCKRCHLPTWANKDAHKICLGCGDTYTITS